MDIRALQGNKLPERNNKVGDTSKSDESAKARSSESASSNASSLSSDTLDISASVSQDEVNQALEAYRNLSKTTLSRLKDIKANMSSGFYMSDAFAENIAGAMIDKLELTGTTPSAPSQPLAFTTEKLEELRQRIAQDGAYLHKLSDKLLDAISKL